MYKLSAQALRDQEKLFSLQYLNLVFNKQNIILQI